MSTPRLLVCCLMVTAMVAVAGAPVVLAHTGRPSAPHDLWTIESWELGAIVGLALAAWLYLRGLRSLWQASAAGHGIRRWEAMAFGAGWLTLSVALVSPLHPLGSVLFSAHMAQHELLMVVAAPLFVLGRPLVPWLWGLPLAWRHSIARWGKGGWRQRVWHALTNPLIAWSLQVVALWSWHAPGLFQAALGNEVIHALQHLSFLVSALLFWWALIHGRQGRMGYGPAVLYVFTTSMQSGALGALLTFAPALWYPAYGGNAAAWGLTPMEDQQLAGLIMWVPASAMYLLAGLALFASWLCELEERERQREGYTLVQAPAVGVEPMGDRRRMNRAVACPLMGGLIIILVGLSSCEQDVAREAAELTGGDPGRGVIAIRQYGCPSCHTIPGVPGAYGLVGPPLGGIASRMYIAGMLPNTPENMILWIQAPQGVNQRTAMPNMGITESEARNIAGYLYTLK
jgi:putative membrane protein